MYDVLCRQFAIYVLVVVCYVRCIMCGVSFDVWGLVVICVRYMCDVCVLTVSDLVCVMCLFDDDLLLIIVCYVLINEVLCIDQQIQTHNT